MYLQRFLSILLLTTSLKFISCSDDILVQSSKLTTALKYGDSCSWENEKLRRELVSAYIHTDPSEKKNVAEKFHIDTVVNHRTLCSASELFVCNKESATCVCGDPGKAGIFPKLISKGYVIEVEDDKKKCRWAEGSYCVASDFVKSEGVDSDSKCMQGTTCTSISDGKPCSFLTVLLYTLRNYHLGMEGISKDMFEGKICTCKADENGNSSDSGEEKSKDTEGEYLPGRLQKVRAKRGVNFDRNFGLAYPSIGIMAPIADIV